MKLRGALEFAVHVQDFDLYLSLTRNQPLFFSTSCRLGIIEGQTDASPDAAEVDNFLAGNHGAIYDQIMLDA